jgi:hypothetical protein
VVLLAAIGGAALYELIRWPGFQPQFIDVTGLNIVERNDVLDKAQIDHHSNVWFLDRKAAIARVQTLPYVQTAQIAILPPAHVTIAVTEREPFGCVIAADGTRFLVDRELRVLEADCGRKQQPMFHANNVAAVPAPGSFLKNPPLAGMMSAETALSAKGAVYTLYDTDSYGELFAVRPDGIVVKFGSFNDLEAKQHLVEPILDTVRGRLGSIKAVDVRTPATPVIEYR